MKYELTKTKNGARVYSKLFDTLEAAQTELQRWYAIDENKDCGNQTISPLFPIQTKQGQILPYEKAAALEEIEDGWSFVFPQGFSRYDFDNEINEIEEIAD